MPDTGEKREESKSGGRDEAIQEERVRIILGSQSQREHRDQKGRGDGQTERQEEGGGAEGHPQAGQRVGGAGQKTTTIQVGKGGSRQEVARGRAKGKGGNGENGNGAAKAQGEGLRGGLLRVQ
eukprot:12642310-Heterocapsa_arctica.AAC.1